MDLIRYNGEHSITFGDKNTWTDWHLIPTSKPVIAPPSVKVKQVDIPGVNGMIDLTTVLTGYPVYNNRTGSLDFILAPGFEYWENVKTTVMEYLRGRRMNMYLADDPDHFYVGTFVVSGLKSDARNNGITINYDLYPFKKDVVASDDPWLWDPFNFEIGVIRSWSSLTVDGELLISIEDCIEPVMPEITASTAMTLQHTYRLADGRTTKTKEYAIPAGTSVPGFTLRPGLNSLRFVGTGTLGIHYRGGRL